MDICTQCGQIVKELVFNHNICKECFFKYLRDRDAALRNSIPEFSQETIGTVTAAVGSVTGCEAKLARERHAVSTFQRIERKFVTSNKMTTPPRSWQPHHFRHMVSGSVVFALGVMAHVILDEVKYRWPRDVKWGDGSVTHGFQRGYSKISTNAVIIGITDDGSLVWREITNK